MSVLVREGDEIAANDGVLELETDKAVVEINCPHAGRITKISCGQRADDKNRSAGVEDRDGIGNASAPSAARKRLPFRRKRRPRRRRNRPRRFGGPEARRLAREMGVDLARLSGSGRGGRITVEDVRAAAGSLKTPAEEAISSRSDAQARGETYEPVVPPGELGQDAYGRVRRERMSRIRRTIAAQMVKSAATIPHVTHFDDADVTDLERIRKTVPPAYLGPAITLTMMPFVMKAVASALRRHPAINASLDEEKQEIVYKEYVHIGVAVDTPRGLVVPVVRNVDQLDVPSIARGMAC